MRKINAGTLVLGAKSLNETMERSGANSTEGVVSDKKAWKPKLSDSQLVILSTAARAERAIGREDLKKLKAKSAALKVSRYRILEGREAA